MCSVYGLRSLLVWAALLASVAGAQQFSFGVESAVEPPTAAADTILLAAPAATTTWSAASDKAWLHVETASGIGSGTIKFSVAANPETQVRSGAITVGGQSFPVVQAGAQYVAARPLTTLVSSGLVETSPYGVAVDPAGDVYLSDPGDRTIKKWISTTGALTTLVGSGLGTPTGIAANARGDVAFSDWDAGAIKWRSAATGEVTTLLDGIFPTDVAFDTVGNVLFADLRNDNELFTINPSTREVGIVFAGTSWTHGVAVNACGDVYVAGQNGNNWGVITWAPGAVEVTPIVHGDNVYGVGVDGAGNVHFTQASRWGGKYMSAVGKWIAATGETEWLAPEWGSWWGTVGMAVDRQGNVYIGDGAAKRLQAIPNSWVDPTAQFIGAAAGSETLPPVLPATTNLAGGFAPSSDQPWLTIKSVAGGVVRYAFTSNTTGADRTAHLTVLGQQIAVTQSAGLVTLGARATVVGPEAATGTVLVAAAAPTTPWTATAGATWLHPASAGGTGDALFTYSCDANLAAAPRTGGIVIGGTVFTIMQAGAGYEVVEQYFPLVTDGLGSPKGVAVDADGNVVLADYQNGQLKKWWARTGGVSTLVASGLNGPDGVAFDSEGNVLIADSRNNAIMRWRAADGLLETVVGSGLARPDGVAVARNGDVLIADSEHNAIKRWSAADGQVSAVVETVLDTPGGVAVDLLGNVSFADRFHYRTKRWSAADGIVRDLWEHDTHGVAADGLGNVLIATGSEIARWSAATGDTSVLASVGAGAPFYVASDDVGNVYFSASMAQTLYELPHAYVDTTPRLASSGQWAESFAPVLALAPNLTGGFVPTSDQPWLLIDKVEGGRITYHTKYNRSGSPRSGHITVLGKQIPITQHSTDTWTYAAFQQWNFAPAECADPTISGPAADPSGRGVSNLLAYGLGLDPWSPDTGGLPRAMVVDGVYDWRQAEDGTYQPVELNGVLQLTFRKASSAVDLDYIVEASSDLVHWEPTPILADETVLDSMHYEETYQDLSSAGAARRFMRVRVTKR
ncbi:MAG: hypothetical protein IPL39_21375 [Opitutaceae bacterium]|nr:hypothetical protein [Opitutaceae bacterium]